MRMLRGYDGRMGNESWKRPMSYSRMSTFLECKRLYYYKYHLNLQKVYDSPALRIGSLVDHGLCEAIESGEQTEDAMIVAADAVAEKYREWIRDPGVKAHFDQHPEDMDESADTAAECQSIAMRAIRSFGIGDRGRWLPIDGLTRSTQIEMTYDSSSHDYVHRWPYGVMGKVDWLTRDARSGDHMVIDFKTSSKKKTLEALEMDFQMPIYMKLLHLNDIEVDTTAVAQIRSRAARAPALTKSGTMSRANITSDWDTYRQAVVDAGLDPNDYLDMRGKLPPMDEISIIERSREEIDNIWSEVASIGRTMFEWHVAMEDQVVRYPGLRSRRLKSMTCLHCEFREPCMAGLRGHDEEHILSEGYRVRKLEVVR